MSKTATEILIPKGTEHGNSTYVFIAPLPIKKAKAKMVSPHQFSRERISIRWMDRYQQYRVTYRPDKSILDRFFIYYTEPNLDQIISHISSYGYIQLH